MLAPMMRAQWTEPGLLMCFERLCNNKTKKEEKEKEHNRQG